MCAVRIAVHVTPRSGRNEVGDWAGGELVVRVTAPPDEGKANRAACSVVAKALRVPKSSVRVLRGETSRHKILEVQGTDDSSVTAALGAPPARDDA